MKKIGIMGGTFNPIHYGHLIMAQYAAFDEKLDKVIFVPNGNPPHKNDDSILDKKHRFDMVKMAIEQNARFYISDFETSNENYSYTVDTVEHFMSLYDAELYFIIGEDSLFQLDTWHNFPDLAKMCKFIVFNRMLDDKSYLAQEKPALKKAKKLEQKYGFDIILKTMPYIAITSTNIRERIKNGSTIRYLVPDNVHDYIMTNGFYK